jgi:prepilin-type N-terminal cleavage/methylation domain-containing protein
MMKSFLKAEQGFTLVELLIVIAILAILAVLAVPRFVNMQAQAAADACHSNQASLSTAVEQYAYYKSIDTTTTPLAALVDGNGFLASLTQPISYTPNGGTATSVTILKNTPKCGRGGVYNLTAATGVVTCSLGNTVSPAH